MCISKWKQFKTIVYFIIPGKRVHKHSQEHPCGVHIFMANVFFINPDMCLENSNVSTWDPRCFLTITTVPERHTPLMQVFSNIALFVWMVWRVHQWREVLAACLTNGRWWAGLKEYNLFLTELLNSLPPWFLTVFLRRTIVCIFWEPPSWMNHSVSFQETFDNFSFSVTPTSKLHLLISHFLPHFTPWSPHAAKFSLKWQTKPEEEKEREKERKKDSYFLKKREFLVV